MATQTVENSSRSGPRRTTVSRLAETNRAPFDLPEAEAESVAGYNVEYARDAILNSSLLADSDIGCYLVVPLTALLRIGLHSSASDSED